MNEYSRFLSRRVGLLTAGAGLAIAGLLLMQGTDRKSQAADKEKHVKTAGLQAVEPDMHEFMEYVFQPSYRRLQSAMQSEPVDKRGWKPIKAESLTLAEAGNLILLRGPDKNRDEWNRLSIAIRMEGAKLYQAGRKRDFQAARRHYTALIRSCNTCHQKFAGGEHQLKP